MVWPSAFWPLRQSRKWLLPCRGNELVSHGCKRSRLPPRPACKVTPTSVLGKEIKAGSFLLALVWLVSHCGDERLSAPHGLRAADMEDRARAINRWMNQWMNNKKQTADLRAWSRVLIKQSVLILEVEARCSLLEKTTTTTTKSCDCPAFAPENLGKFLQKQCGLPTERTEANAVSYI